jgi:hypothetical protein
LPSVGRIRARISLSLSSIQRRSERKEPSSSRRSTLAHPLSHRRDYRKVRPTLAERAARHRPVSPGSSNQSPSPCLQTVPLEFLSVFLSGTRALPGRQIPQTATCSRSMVIAVGHGDRVGGLHIRPFRTSPIREPTPFLARPIVLLYVS